ncbi:alpha-E domain-containing protein [Salaquimonas pukyongi]|uniref:alpha-E domain-containing protein n=1 Tax=Salaquimonas pukyongi TaxID=2712698 RepID=UPI00096BBF72|nr:alpha-E domain-containing protein [Salaquimonas pukyongi]
MLGKTAGGLFWMFRYLERSEYVARLVEAGLRLSLTRPHASSDEWASVVDTAGVRDAYLEKSEAFDQAGVVDFLLRETDSSTSVLSCITAARTNARLVRTALTREVWEATNECWMAVCTVLQRKVGERELPDVLNTIRQQSALVRGALHGTMMRDDAYDFARLGTFVERADNTARILDVKYYVLLPSAMPVGSAFDNVQWENILRSVSAHRSFRHVHNGETNAAAIAEFLILDRRMPRALAFCYGKIRSNLAYLESDYGARHDCHDMAQEIYDELRSLTIASVFERGLHEYIAEFITRNNALGLQIEADYRFTE